MCERMLTKQRGVADVYSGVVALRLTILAQGFREDKDRRKHLFNYPACNPEMCPL